MPEIIYPSSRTIKGPILLSINDLERLDEVLDKIYDILVAELLKTVEEEVTKIVGKYSKEDKYDINMIRKITEESYPFNKKQKLITVFCNDGKKVVAEKIRDIIKDPKITDLKPHKLFVEINISTNEFELEINEYNGEMDYRVKSGNSSLSTEILFEFEKWAKITKPNKIVQTWYNLKGIQFLFILAFSLYTLIFVKSPRDLYKKELYKEIKELILKGIDNSNIPNAVDLLLKLDSNYVPNDFVYPSTLSSILPALFILIVFSLIFTYPPKTCIGFGKNEKKVELLRLWIKFVLYVIPVLVILPIILNQIKIF